MKKKLLILTFILISFLSFSNDEFVQEDLRVGIGRLKSDKVYLKADKGCLILSYKVGEELFEELLEMGKIAKLEYNNGKIHYKGRVLEQAHSYKGDPETLIHLSNDGETYYPYRGDFYFISYKNKLLPVNLVQSEEYLYSVVPCEIGTYFPEEAIKAQAVAARTYLYYNLENSKYTEFELLDNTSSQVYLGYAKENEKVKKLVDETRGEIVIYSGKPINALYHSASGGYTANNEDVWGGKAIPYLRAKNDSGNGGNSPRSKWSYRVSLKKLSEKFGFKVRDVKILEKKNGRVVRVQIVGDKSIAVSGNRLRRIIGYTHIFSTMFKVEKRGSEIVFSGSGSGHGVGMSQWGAYTLAKNGKNYSDILKFYYRGTQIKSLKKSENML